jgi:hypothetical protein
MNINAWVADLNTHTHTHTHTHTEAHTNFCMTDLSKFPLWIFTWISLSMQNALQKNLNSNNLK